VASPDELQAQRRRLHGFPEEQQDTFELVADELSILRNRLRSMVAAEKSSLWNMIKDVEPLDLSVVERYVPPETVDAMKRTVSGILGLLPSDK